jgi:ppGpp synthetase/RelA/SpoT-type nucleotidyltranferase
MRDFPVSSPAPDIDREQGLVQSAHSPRMIDPIPWRTVPPVGFCQTPKSVTKMSESKQNVDDERFEGIVSLHGRLTDVAIELVRNLLERNDVEYLSVMGRTKDIDSIKEKIRRKDYKTPRTQMTDISGIRVITYLESQVERIVSIIRRGF